MTTLLAKHDRRSNAWDLFVDNEGNLEKFATLLARKKARGEWTSFAVHGSYHGCELGVIPSSLNGTLANALRYVRRVVDNVDEREAEASALLFGEDDGDVGTPSYRRAVYGDEDGVYARQRAQETLDELADLRRPREAE